MIKPLLLFFLLITTIARSQTITVEAEAYDSTFGGYKGKCVEGGKVLRLREYDWAQYIINIPTNGIYKLELRTAGWGGQMAVLDTNENVLAHCFPPYTMTHQTYATSAAYVYLKSGVQKLRLQALSNVKINLNWLKFSHTNLIIANSFETDYEYAGSSGAVPWGSAWADSTAGGQSSAYRWIKQTARPGSLVLNNFVPYKGRSSAFFELNKTDSATWPYVRSELYLPFSCPAEMWLGFAFRSPTIVAGDGNRHIICQWHGWDDVGEGARSPCIALEVENDSFKLKVLWASAPINSNDTKDGEIVYNLGKYEPNVWVKWTFHIKFAYNTTGILEVWRDGIQVVSRINLPNSYNDQNLPYFKFGIYKWGWKGGHIVNGQWKFWAEYTPYDQLNHHFDEFKMGDENSTYNEVQP